MLLGILLICVTGSSDRPSVAGWTMSTYGINRISKIRISTGTRYNNMLYLARCKHRRTVLSLAPTRYRAVCISLSFPLSVDVQVQESNVTYPS